jgi:hypothetical protein
MAENRVRAGRAMREGKGIADFLIDNYLLV